MDIFDGLLEATFNKDDQNQNLTRDVGDQVSEGMESITTNIVEGLRKKDTNDSVTVGARRSVKVETSNGNVGVYVSTKPRKTGSEAGGTANETSTTDEDDDEDEEEKVELRQMKIVIPKLKQAKEKQRITKVSDVHIHTLTNMFLSRVNCVTNILEKSWFDELTLAEPEKVIS